MNSLVGCSSLKFAVIEVLTTKDGRECVVLAYPDEGSLRDLIAARSIVALGFASRDRAVASIRRRFYLSADAKNMVKTAVLQGIKNCQRELYSARRQFSDWFCFADFPGIASRAMQRAVAAAILFLYSGNALSAAIRTFIGC